MATFKKVAGGWQAQVYVNGLRKAKTLPTKAEVKSWAAQIEHELSQFSDGVSLSHTFGDALRRYAEEVSEQKKGARWEIVRIQKISRDRISSIKLNDLRREDFESFIDRNLKTLKSSSVNRELNLLSHVLTQCRRWRLMKHNPMEDLARPKNPPSRDRRVYPHEIELLMQSHGYSEETPANRVSAMVGLAFLFALETAMRAGEICGIYAHHVNMNDCTVFLPDTKNGFPRTVPMTPEAVRLIKRLEPWSIDKPIFGLTPTTLSANFHKYAEKSGVENIVFHDSRHEATTRLASKLNVLELARVTGHRDIKQLAVYYNKTAAELAKQLAAP